MPDSGTIRLKTWRAGHDPAASAPASERTVKLSGIKAGDAGRKLMCEGDAGGFRVTLACTVNDPGGDQPPFVRIVRSKTFLHLGDGTDDYLISPADQDAMIKFIAGAGLPASRRLEPGLAVPEWAAFPPLGGL